MDLATSFGTLPDAYDRARPDYPREAVEWMVGDARTIADVGAGTGKLTRVLADMGRQVVAVDPDPRMLDVLRAHLPAVPTAIGHGEDIPLADACLDALTFAQAWHWVDPQAGPAEAARVLAPGGVLGLIWNVRDTSVDWVRGMIAHYPPSGSETIVAEGVGDLGESFGPVETHRITWTRPMTPDEIVEMAASRSYVIAAAPQDRARTLADLRTLLATHPDTAGRDVLPMPYTTVAYRARRL